jgi:hypothetical protein
MKKQISVSLDHPLFRGSLSLKRAPKYLRFTVRGMASCSRNWDALDQPEDVPEPGEQVIAAIKRSSGSMHLDRTVNGRRVGEWYETAVYAPIEEQPPDDVIRDTAKWQAWVMAREEQPVTKD